MGMGMEDWDGDGVWEWESLAVGMGMGIGIVIIVFATGTQIFARHLNEPVLPDRQWTIWLTPCHKTLRPFKC